MLSIENPKEYRQQVQDMRFQYYEVENYREPWNEIDNNSLKKLFYDGCGITEIAVQLGRSERATYKQIENLGLFRKIYKTSEKSKQCLKCICPTCGFYIAGQCPKDCVYVD